METVFLTAVTFIFHRREWLVTYYYPMELRRPSEEVRFKFIVLIKPLSISIKRANVQNLLND